MATENGERLTRHAGIDRWFHWVTAATMAVLLATSLLPLLGVRFAWVEIHWIAGLVLTAIILLHILRAVFWQGLRHMMIRPPIWVSFQAVSGPENTRLRRSSCTWRGLRPSSWPSSRGCSS